MKNKQPGTDNLEFDLIGEGTANPFNGYVADQDKTTLVPQTLVQGSQNVRKTYGETQLLPGRVRRYTIQLMILPMES